MEDSMMQIKLEVRRILQAGDMRLLCWRGREELDIEEKLWRVAGWTGSEGKVTVIDEGLRRPNARAEVSNAETGEILDGVQASFGGAGSQRQVHRREGAG
jgi:hypothetical protein